MLIIDDDDDDDDDDDGINLKVNVPLINGRSPQARINVMSQPGGWSPWAPTVAYGEDASGLFSFWP